MDEWSLAEVSSRKLNDHSVGILYNSTHGAFIDLLDASCEIAGSATRPVNLLAQEITKRFDRLTTSCKDHSPRLILFSHSEGCIISEQALAVIAKTRPEIPMHTSLYALGSPKILGPKVANVVDLRISNWDGIGLLDIIGRLQSPDHVKIVQHRGGFPGLDHNVMAKTYKHELTQISDSVKSKWMQ